MLPSFTSTATSQRTRTGNVMSPWAILRSRIIVTVLAILFGSNIGSFSDCLCAHLLYILLWVMKYMTLALVEANGASLPSKLQVL